MCFEFLWVKCQFTKWCHLTHTTSFEVKWFLTILSHREQNKHYVSMYLEELTKDKTRKVGELDLVLHCLLKTATLKYMLAVDHTIRQYYSCKFWSSFRNMWSMFSFQQGVQKSNLVASDFFYTACINKNATGFGLKF